ncbi:MAG: hypothetical protein RI885_1942 [Actinomycetota bacterium]
MLEWIAANPTPAAVILGIAVLLALVMSVLWGISARNTALLSRELDQADDRVAELDAALAAQGTRLTIIRELHEVAVLTLTGMVRQADATRYVVQTDPGVVSRTAGQIADAARSTLADLRRVASIAAEGQSRAVSIPSLSSIVELLDTHRTRGLEISFAESGERFDLPQGAEVAVFRIVEEALANALQFGGVGTDVVVSFTWTDRGLQVLVDDDGVLADARRSGLDPSEISQQRRYSVQDDLNSLVEVVSGEGITEMRARADAFGGVFAAYSVPGVGFSVSAIFPAVRFDNGVHTVDLQG